MTDEDCKKAERDFPEIIRLLNERIMTTKELVDNNKFDFKHLVECRFCQTKLKDQSVLTGGVDLSKLMTKLVSYASKNLS